MTGFSADLVVVIQVSVTVGEAFSSAANATDETRIKNKTVITEANIIEYNLFLWFIYSPSLFFFRYYFGCEEGHEYPNPRVEI
jgi:hypothetical protein